MRKGRKNPRGSSLWVRADFGKKTELTIAEASLVSGVTAATIKIWLSSGFIQRANLVGPFRVERESLERWLRTGLKQGGRL